MDALVIVLIVIAILLFIIGFLLGKTYNHLKRTEIQHLSKKSSELEDHLHDLRYKIGELERQRETLKHEKEERLKKWMDSTNTYERRIKPVKKKKK